MYFKKSGCLNMRVYLGRAYVGVAEQHLDNTQVSPAFEKMRRKGMAKCMRGNVFPYASLRNVALHRLPDILPAEGLSRTVGEKRVPDW